jgi:hypothetical protein
MSSFANAPGTHLQNLVLCANASIDEKASCLRTLRVIVKNLCDPTKARDPKYRQLKLSNEKVQSRMMPCHPHSLEYVKSIGFVATTEGEGTGEKMAGEEDCLRLSSSDDASMIANAMASLAELDHAIDMLVPKNVVDGGDVVISAQPALERDVSASSSSSLTSTVARISEKERARMLLEKKRQSEAKDAKDARRRTTELIRQGESLKWGERVPGGGGRIPPRTSRFLNPSFVFLVCQYNRDSIHPHFPDSSPHGACLRICV